MCFVKLEGNSVKCPLCGKEIVVDRTRHILKCCCHYAGHDKELVIFQGNGIKRAIDCKLTEIKQTVVNLQSLLDDILYTLNNTKSITERVRKVQVKSLSCAGSALDLRDLANQLSSLVTVVKRHR